MRVPAAGGFADTVLWGCEVTSPDAVDPNLTVVSRTEGHEPTEGRIQQRQRRGLILREP